MVSRRVRPLRSAAGSLVLVIGMVSLPAGIASAAPVRPDSSAMVLASGPRSQLQSQNRRLANGAFVRDGNRTGRGELTIKNNTAHDAVITLTIGRSPVYSVYVRGSSEYTVTGIRDNTYEIFFATGTDWDSQSRGFTRDRVFQRFDETMDFTTTSTVSEVRWSAWTITLDPVPGGTATASPVDPSNYPGP
ncbi:MAG TPA: hypothetical protein VFO16_19355 [Pseudonocardiaceae bacterium]|nr:hypothetical protein [Pseudonocardiaceae bacterium]